MQAAAAKPDPSDDALMRAFAAGDGAAFEQLYTRHQPSQCIRLFGSDSFTYDHDILFVNEDCLGVVTNDTPN